VAAENDKTGPQEATGQVQPCSRPESLVLSSLPVIKNRQPECDPLPQCRRVRPGGGWDRRAWRGDHF